MAAALLTLLVLSLLIGLLLWLPFRFLWALLGEHGAVGFALGALLGVGLSGEGE